MIGLLQVTTVCLITLLALATASAVHWALLRAAFVLLRPAAARRK